MGTPPQTGRVIFSTAGDETWLVVAAGCPSAYPKGCAENRGGQFNPSNSTSWVSIDLATLRLEENLGYTGKSAVPLWNGRGIAQEEMSIASAEIERNSC